MNKIYFLLVVVFISSCEKKTTTISKNSEASIVDFSMFDTNIKIDSTLIINQNNENLRLFYRKFNYETVWLSEENRKNIISQISISDEDGLDLEDYNFSKLNALETRYHSLSEEELITYDILMTTSFYNLVSHLHKGKLQPKNVYTDWDLEAKKTNINNLISNCVEGASIKETLDNARPNHAKYLQLKNSLRILRELPEENFEILDVNSKKVLTSKSLKANETIKRKLMFWGDMPKKDSVTSSIDKETIKGIKNFQTRHGLKADGVIGITTLYALNHSKKERIEQVIANLERWRWFARDFGKHYILTNIPDYKLVVVKEGDTTQRQNVVVGKEARRTPVLESKISNINLNPNWTVPPTILAEDVFPDAIKNWGAFSKKNLTLYNWKNQEVSGREWKIEEATKYKYVEKPGRNSALGLMKINFPNKYSVYMHDTNHRNFFKLNYRSLSSGCVRLEKPLEMAAYILNDTVNWSLKKIKDTTDINYYFKLKREKEKKLAEKDAELMAKNPLLVITPKKLRDPELKTITIKVLDEILIHQLYWTAWEQNGKLQFREDIYCLDQELYSKLRH